MAIAAFATARFSCLVSAITTHRGLDAGQFAILAYMPASRPVIYVTGHRNPDTDPIACAIGHAELGGRPCRAQAAARYERRVRASAPGEVNAQTRWLLEYSEATEPELLARLMLRVCDVMHEGKEMTRAGRGLAMAAGGFDLMPIVDDCGSLVGVRTERALARRYIRESRRLSAAPSLQRRSARRGGCRSASSSPGRRATPPAGSGRSP
jgi:hypothetical protein